MQDIKDFQEGYASLKDVVPYKTKSKSAAEKNKWYQRSVQEAWEELHGGGEEGEPSPEAAPAAASKGASKGRGRGRGRAGGSKGRARGRGGRGKAGRGAAAASKGSPELNEAIRRSLADDAGPTKRQRGAEPGESAKGAKRTRGGGT